MHRLILTFFAIVVLSILAYAATPTTPILYGKLQTGLNGNNNPVTNVSYYIGSIAPTNFLPDGATNGQVLRWFTADGLWKPSNENGGGTNLYYYYTNTFYVTNDVYLTNNVYYTNNTFVTNDYWYTNNYLYTNYVYQTNDYYITNNAFYTNEVYVTNNFNYTNDFYYTNVTYVTNDYWYTNNFNYTNDFYYTNYYTNIIVQQLTNTDTVYYTNSVVADVAWPGPTNSINFASGALQSFSANEDCAITNVINAVSGYGNGVLLCITNMANGVMNVYAPTNLLKIGDGESSPYMVTNFDIIELWFYSSKGRLTLTSRRFH